MKVGSLVELVDDNWPRPVYTNIVNKGCRFPVKKTIYTVRAFPTADSIVLEEIVNPIIFGKLGRGGTGWAEPTFSVKRFKELMPPMEISVEEILKEKIDA